MSLNLNKNKFNYLFLGLLNVVLIIGLIPHSILNSRIALAGFLILFTIVAKNYCNSVSSYKFGRKKITQLMLLLAVLYVIFYYLFGVFTKYNVSSIRFSFKTLFQIIIPIAVMVICSEKIRKVFLLKNDKLTTILLFICEVLIDILIYSTAFFFTDLERILIVLGNVLFPTISVNLLYNYISKSYGEKPVIIYRLITSLFMYIIPIEPSIYSFFKGFYKITYPALMYYIIDGMYGEIEKGTSVKNLKLRNIVFVVTLTITILLMMLISCRFSVGTLVVGSDSMVNEIKVGDVVVFHRYNNEKLEVGQIIVFEKNSKYVIHRIYDEVRTSGEVRYHTKGDANETVDPWIVENSEILGVVDFKLPYVGYPSIMIRRLIDGGEEV